jgi:hypothetical protein
MVNMVKLRMITFCTSYIVFMLVSHMWIFMIDHAEQGREEPSEPAQVEGANYEQD